MGSKEVFFFSKWGKYCVCILIEMIQQVMLERKERLTGSVFHRRVGKRGCGLVQQQKTDRSGNPDSVGQENSRRRRCRSR